LIKPNLSNFGSKLKFKVRKEKKELTEKELFVDFINHLYVCWLKTNQLYGMFGISLLEYEEYYYKVIEDLILLKYGFSKTEIILWYVFERTDLEGNIYPLLFQDENTTEEQELILKTPEDLWNFFQMLDNKPNEKK